MYPEYDPNVAAPVNPLAKFIMPTAAQQAAQQPPQGEDKTQMLIDALRQGQGGMGGGGAPVSSGRVQSAGYMGQGMNTNAIGTALGSLLNKPGAGTGNANPALDPVTVSPDMSGFNW